MNIEPHSWCLDPAQLEAAITPATQPYLFPYLGYFQLLHHADVLVLLDDVAYINRGWINRNRL